MSRTEKVFKVNQTYIFMSHECSELLYTPKQLSATLGVSKETLRQWSNNGKLRVVKTKGGHRRYCLEGENKPSNSKRCVVYARVSSFKQQGDLQRQISLLQRHYPNHEVIFDIASGLNFNRKGLKTILELMFNRNLEEVVVAHRDRLSRFGFDLFEEIFKQHNVNLKVLSDTPSKEPITELAEDLLSIVTVFTARYYGSRKYKTLQENKDLSKQRAKTVVYTMSRSLPLLLQQNKPFHKNKTRKQRKTITKTRNHKKTRNEE
jgi:excisionase family DNA binding protein